MRFTQQICKEVFCQSKFRPDSEPEFCIARGLARVGRIDLHSSGFRARVEELCDSSLIQDAVEKELPRFMGFLGQALSEGIVTGAVRPAVCDWRDGRIRTLAGLEKHIAKAAKDWLTSEAGQQAVKEQYLHWFDLIQGELSRPISGLCQEFHLPAGALQLDTVSALNQLESSALPQIEGFRELDEVTAAIVRAVSYTIFAASFLFMLPHHLHPIGWLIDIAIGFLVATYGVEGAKEKVKEFDIPDFVRTYLLSDQKIEAKCREMPEQLAPKLAETLRQNKKMFSEVGERVREQIRKALCERAEAAIILIQ